MAHYKQPSRINPVSLLLLLAAGAVAYAGVKFAPPFWRDREIKGKIEEAVNRMWRDRNVPGVEGMLHDQVTAQIRELGIDDPGLLVSVEKTAERMRISASYTVVISHPGRKITTLRFEPSFETDTKSLFD